MRVLLIPVVLAALNTAAFAQQNSVATVAQSTPVTKVLALGRLTAAATPDKFPPVMGDEVRDTVRLFLGGKIDQWYSRKDQNGVVFVMNVTSVEEAHNLLEALPLGKAKLMEFDLIPLGPLAPLRLLVNSPPTSNAAKQP